MIIPVEKIPIKEKPKEKSQRDRIIEDFEEAVANNVLQFEFEGDYTWNNLPAYASAIAKDFTVKKINECIKERGVCSAYGSLVHFKFSNYLNSIKKRDVEYIKIFKKQEDDRMHVYCRINPDEIDRVVDMIEEIEQEKKRRNNDPDDLFV